MRRAISGFFSKSPGNDGASSSTQLPPSQSCWPTRARPGEKGGHSHSTTWGPRANFHRAWLPFSHGGLEGDRMFWRGACLPQLGSRCVTFCRVGQLNMSMWGGGQVVSCPALVTFPCLGLWEGGFGTAVS